MSENTMRHHHIYLHLAKEIHDHCQDMIITECYSQEKNILVIRCESQDGSSIAHIEWIMHSASPIILLKKDMQRAKSNSVDLFPSIIGRKICSCTKHPNDRMIFLKLTGATIIGQFFGGAHTGLFVIDASDRVIDIFKRAPHSVGEEYVPSLNSMPTLDDMNPTLPINEVLIKAEHCGKLYAKEIFVAFTDLYPHITSDVTLQELSDSQWKELKTCFHLILDASFQSNTAYILELANSMLCISCIPLRESVQVIWSGESMSEVIRRFQGLKHKQDRMKVLTQEIASDLHNRREKLERTITHVSEEENSQARIAESQHIAQLLLSMPYPALRVHDDTIVLLNAGIPISIPAMKGKTYAEHAEYYFKKAKHARERIETRRMLLPEFRLQLEQVISMQKELNQAQDFRALESMHKKLQSKKTEHGHNPIQQLFREFRLNAHYVLFIGRNAQNNDQLTTKFAKPNDLWLHARGVSGSHAILRGPLNPPKNILEMACEITAYFSKSRNASFVPVAYALKKYVRKPKGAGPGSVIMEREEVTMVEPRLPEGTIDS